MNWQVDNQLHARVSYLINHLQLNHVDPSRIFCFKSMGSSGRSIARIWSLPTIWQQALQVSPAYCLEVVWEKYSRLSLPEQEKVLIHELLHIPKTFSGSLVPHRTAHHRTFRHYHDRIESLFRQLVKKSYE